MILMPHFIISFGGAVYDDYKIRYEGKLYKATDFTYDVESLHIYGKKDPF